ncbi:SpoIIE family protein phosphatase [Kitasatospora atroaurantiaca]|uniref:Serine phosphatase RsbU (Regulator of sigma subunit) n=1 Tax=Kitasatospora atroaurantiaca TaxID=285545 RepID=A0A561EW44_9ACTN|nr:SpoIIE family protein phosphatase [Kitasatospora atroaurantiaca]TWE19827.1 serine phosphatase RsbU (regulator of sigma subunit) [Kitasatospora atroaurantiaca]
MVTARAAATFEPVGRSAAAARGFVRDALLGWGLPEVVDDAVVLVSELVTNAVVHAGTAAEVRCLREEETVRIEVTDRHPERGLPSFANVSTVSSDRYADPDGEGGRGLLMCSALSSCWGVEYTAGRKTVWFRLTLPEHVIGTRYALPSLPGGELPSADGPVHVAVVQVDEHDRVQAWNADAEALFQYPAEQVHGRPWADLAAWPQSAGIGLGLSETLRLARWEGSFGLRRADGLVVEVYGLQVRVRDTHGTPSTLCLLVREPDRSILRSPGTAAETPSAVEPLDLLVGPVAPDDLGALLQRIVERARDLLDADAAYLLLTTDDETEFEVRAATGLAVAAGRFARQPIESGGRFDSARLPSVHEDLAVRPTAAPMLTGTGLRSLITVPLKVEGRLTGSLGVAAATPGRYDNEDALRLQFAADRIALALESARLTELERLRRGSLSFLVEASDLLAGTLEHEQTLALMAQMAVPTLASWCAVYTTVEQGTGAGLAFVLHEDEDRIDQLRALLDKTPAPDSGPAPGAAPGARFWKAPSETARASGLTDSPELSGLLGETVVLPLAARNRVIGLLVLGVGSGVRFRQEILELAEDLSRRAALALDNSRLYSERTATSQAFQRALLPPELPKIPGVEVEVFYQAAGEGNEVGGDFYDIFPIREGTYGFAIGDVCGTGPEAASVTGLARHSLRLLAREGLDAPQVLTRLNAAILDEGTRSRFLTLLYGELTPRPDGSTALSLVCAGHPLPLRLRTDGRVDAAASPQPLLGVMDDLELTAEELVLQPGEVLLCVTDGVTERREGRRMLGDDGLAQVLTGCTGLTAGAVAARVQRAVERFAPEPPSDDMAILTLRVPAQRVG